jgi:hypothetical protein
MAYDFRKFLADFDYLPQVKGKKAKPIVRQYATRYYDDVGAGQDQFVRHGAASSEDGAIGALAPKIVGGKHAKALVYDRKSGHVLYAIVPSAEGYRIIDAPKKMGWSK